MTPIKSAEALALWLSRNEPMLFEQLQMRAMASEAGESNLAGVMDWLKSAGTSVTNAVKSVGTFISSPAGMQTMVGLGTTLLQNKQQMAVLQTQAAMAQAGMTPAPIQNTTNAYGQTVPVYTPTNQVVSPQILASLQPTFLQQYALPLTVGGGILLIMLAMRR